MNLMHCWVCGEHAEFGRLEVRDADRGGDEYRLTLRSACPFPRRLGRASRSSSRFRAATRSARAGPRWFRARSRPGLSDRRRAGPRGRPRSGRARSRRSGRRRRGAPGGKRRPLPQQAGRLAGQPWGDYSKRCSRRLSANWARLPRFPYCG